MKRLRKIIGNKSGITLLEVLIAMLILSMSLLLLLNMAMVAVDGNDWSNKTTIATQLMQEKLEEIRGTSNFVDGTDVVDGVTRTWRCSDAGPHLMRVDVQVDWEDVRSKDKSNTMTAFVRTE